jgi:glucokinase
MRPRVTAAHRTGLEDAAAGGGVLLAGDVGGTKVAMGLYTLRQGGGTPLLEAEFPSGRYPGLGAVVREFLGNEGVRIDRACFAVAGPVIGGRAQVTNLPWVLSEDELAAELHVPAVHLLNDLVAIARAVPELRPADLHTLNVGAPVPGGAIGVVAPGTGLGEAFLVWDGARYQAYPSEGGHADFAPTSAIQAGLLAFLLRELDHVSVERVCSGPGLINIHRYLLATGHPAASLPVTQAVAVGQDSARSIADAALRRPEADPLSAAALELFVSVLGSEAGSFALKVLSTGGVYLAGGIPMRVVPALENGRFMRAFTSKGRMRDLLSRVPVHVVLRRAALLGAALRGFEVAAAHAASA